MPEEPTDPPAPETEPPPPEGDQENVDELPKWARDALSKANKEAAGYRTKVKELEPLAQRAKELEDASKSDADRAAERLAEAERRAELAESTLLRTQVAAEKGLTAGMAKRLVGTTREELEADADELLGETQTETEERPPGRPRERLRPGYQPEPGGEDPDIDDAVRRIRRF